MLTKWTPRITGAADFFDCLILDEAQSVRNDTAKRTQMLLGQRLDDINALVTWAQYAWHVTGTPMHNGPIDVYSFLRFAEVVSWDKRAFEREFFTARVGKHSIKYHPRP